MARIEQFVSIYIMFCSITQLASSCGVGEDVVTTPKPIGTTAATVKSTIWVRCKSGTKQVCRELMCNEGEIALKSTFEPYKSETSCLGSTLYQQCYNFATDGFGIGTCQPDYIGCTSSTQKVLGEAFDDASCIFISSRVRTYVRCLNSISNAAQCRPEQANCFSSSETWSPLNNVFFSLDVCTNYGIDPNASGFYRCVTNTTGVVACKSALTGCDTKTETRVPWNVIYSSSNECSTPGSTQQLYDLCYDYKNSDPTYYGTCIPADGTCSAVVTKTRILSGLVDPYCNAFARDSSKIKYMRCQVTATGAYQCRPTDVQNCNPDGSETRPFPLLTYSTKADCQTALYDLCYDYNNADPTYSGQCQPIEAGCTGATKKKLLSSVADSSCAGLTVSAYIRCVVTATSVVNCRPSNVVTCNPDGSEPQDPASTFPQSSDCTTYVANPNILCGFFQDGSQGCSCVQTMGECDAIVTVGSFDMSIYNGALKCTDVCKPAPAGFYYGCQIGRNGIDIGIGVCATSQAACESLSDAGQQIQASYVGYGGVSWPSGSKCLLV